MPFRYITPAGEIDETKLAIAIERRADELARLRAKPVSRCIDEARALCRSIAKVERDRFLADQAELPREAATCFVRGMLEGLTPEPDAYNVSTLNGPGIGSYERSEHCSREISRQRNDALLATFDRCLAEAGARMDRGNHLLAAE